MPRWMGSLLLTGHDRARKLGQDEDDDDFFDAARHVGK